MELNEQPNNANDQNAGLNKIGICDHCQPPFLYDREAKRSAPRFERGTHRLPFIDNTHQKNTITASK